MGSEKVSMTDLRARQLGQMREQYGDREDYPAHRPRGSSQFIAAREAPAPLPEAPAPREEFDARASKSGWKEPATIQTPASAPFGGLASVGWGTHPQLDPTQDQYSDAYVGGPHPKPLKRSDILKRIVDTYDRSAGRPNAVLDRRPPEEELNSDEFLDLREHMVSMEHGARMNVHPKHPGFAPVPNFHLAGPPPMPMAHGPPMPMAYGYGPRPRMMPYM